MKIEFPENIISKSLTNIKYGECCMFECELKIVYMRVNTKCSEVFITMINLQTAILTKFPSETLCIPVKTKLIVTPYTD
jgi:hypothetical protein